MKFLTFIRILLPLIICAVLFRCTKDVSLPPTAVFTIFPVNGDSTTTFTFDASVSMDDINTLKSLLVRWDIDDDGIWDTEFSQDKIFSYCFGKSGIVRVKLEVKDIDGLSGFLVKEVFIWPENLKSTMTDERDNREYKIVKVGDQWWMAENLNYGKLINSSVFQTNNDTVEKYSRRDRDSSGLIYGGYYQWEEVMDYNIDTTSQGICPEGWHIPTKYEWDKVFQIYNPIISQFFVEGGNSGLDFLGGGMLWFCLDNTFCWGNRSWKTFSFITEHVNKFWSSSVIPINTNQLSNRYYNTYRKYLITYIDLYYIYPFRYKYCSGFSAMPVRCVKDN